LGRIVYLQGDPASAVPYLEKATQIEPKTGEAHTFLADAYEQLGKGAEAGRERGLAKRLQQ